MISAAKNIWLWLERGLQMGASTSYAMTRQEGALSKHGKHMEIVVEKGIPLPEGRRGKWDILSELEIHDSIRFQTLRDFDRARRAALYRGIKFRSRKERDGSGYRIWRVE